MEEHNLKKLQKVEFGILKVLDEFCEAHEIDYSLYAGTALGAVRHGGFIPWDDDVDVCMTRKDYIKFCKAWEENPLNGYYFQNFLNDPYCATCHGKLRKDNTILLSEGEDENVGHHGVWVDIFPMDKLSNDEEAAKQLWRVGKQIIYLTRANAMFDNDSLQKKIVRSILRMKPASTRDNQLRKAMRWICDYDDRLLDNYDWISMSTLEGYKWVFPKNMMEDMIKINFEGYDFKISKHYQTMLTILYGEYMELPPLEERICKHQPKKIVL